MAVSFRSIIAEQKKEGDYLFAVKGNQGRLNKAFEEKFPLKELNNPEHDSYAISEKSHGREEIRLHIVCDVPDLDFLKQYGDFENGIPVHDTIARVVSCISPSKFHECFINWMRDCHTSDDKDVIAIGVTVTQLVKRVTAEKKSVFTLFAMSLMNLLISHLNGKG